MLLIKSIIVGFFGIQFLFSQWALSGLFESSVGKSKNNYNYRESYLTLNSFWKNWSGWVQFEYSNPPELGLELTGLRKFSLEYESDRLHLKVGDIYNFWGRGLVLNQYDNTSIDFDNGIRGISAGVSFPSFSGNLLLGKSEFWRSSNQVLGFNERVPNYKVNFDIGAAQLQTMMNALTVGLEGAWVLEEHPIPFNQDWEPDTVEIHHISQGIFVEFFGESFDFVTEIVGKAGVATYPTKPLSHNENSFGLFTHLNMYYKGWTLGSAYKKYSFANLNPEERWDSVNHYLGAIPFQQAPTVFREHSTPLLNRISHQIDPNDEIGYQIRLEGPIGQNTTFLTEYSQSSRQFVWAVDDEFNWTVSEKTQWYPFKKKTGNPFSEMFIQFDGVIPKYDVYYTLGYSEISDVFNVIYNNVGQHPDNQYRVEFKKGWTVPLHFSFPVFNQTNLDLKIEYQELKKGIMIKEYDFYQTFSTTSQNVRYSFISNFPEPVQINRHYSIGISPSSKWGIVLNLDNTSTEDRLILEKGRKESSLEKMLMKIIDMDLTWASLEAVYNISDNHRLTVMYGSQRGGVLCSNGVCRYIQPFEDGIKFNLISNF